MAGDVEGLDQAEVEAGFRTAMLIGLPVDINSQPAYPVFVLAPPPNGDPSFADAHRVPWNPSEDMVTSEDVVDDALCAVETINLRDEQVAGGVAAQRTAIVVTLLAAEWNQVQTCVAVRIGGVQYDRWKTPPPMALGPIGVYQIVFRTKDS